MFLMQKRRRNGSCYDLHEHIYYGFFMKVIMHVGYFGFLPGVAPPEFRDRKIISSSFVDYD